VCSGIITQVSLHACPAGSFPSVLLVLFRIYEFCFCCQGQGSGKPYQRSDYLDLSVMSTPWRLVPTSLRPPQTARHSSALTTQHGMACLRVVIYTPMGAYKLSPPQLIVSGAVMGTTGPSHCHGSCKGAEGIAHHPYRPGPHALLLNMVGSG
jgi:hypothetical protein